YSPAQQARTIATLQDNMSKLRARDVYTLREMGIMHTQDDDASEEVAAALIRCHWQMAQLLRFSTPSRIAEAETHIRAVLTAYDQQNPGTVDAEPALYLAVILARIPEHEDEALALYRAASASRYIGAGTRVWAQAAIARMLRRTGRQTEAQEAETAVLNWFKSHPAAMHPQAFRALVLDEDD
ncbi:hypothetical protein K488DRAFT_10909, partial [Vararia minispora EC-137]